MTKKNQNNDNDNELDVNSLLKSLDNDDNLHLINLTTQKLHQMNFQILQELELKSEEITSFLGKLEGFKYVDDLTDLRPGTYMRWISLLNPDTEATLAKGAFFCRTTITDDGIKIVLKTLFNRHLTLNFDDYLFFYMLTNEEKVLLSVLDHLES